MMKCMLEHHPNDSRIKIDQSGTCQSLTQRMGTGGGNVPLVLEIEDDCGVYRERTTASIQFER